ncbi:alpha/beta hydrolase [Actinocatenispora comari]|uniref:Esterase n=1 Tax=Actinocatenispora comari TaxID=2807577 RepID=A0A8J4ESG9_9ACTN|nr:alpha/beta hydrolase-fold protein [Actinocatenispora comari]GIL31929.1 esterase [Actinocatenispora comari]
MVHPLVKLTGTTLIAIVAVTAVALVAGAVLTWRRWRRCRMVRTVAALACSQLLVALTVGLAVNQRQDFFSSWTDLAGADTPPAVAPRVTAGAMDARAAEHARNAEPGHGVVLAFRLHGARSKLNLPALVYLPPQYSLHSWRQRRFPVVEFLDGFPGRPTHWTNSLHIQTMLDAEIRAGRMPPTVAVFPTQSTDPSTRDSECVDEVHGPQYATYLTSDVKQVLRRDFRVLPGRSGWGLIGYSTGGFCAANLALRRGFGYAAAASISGEFAPYTGPRVDDLFHGDRTVREANTPTWVVRHDRHLPAIAVYAACARPDPEPCQEGRTFARAARGSPVSVQKVELPTGGHNFYVWRAVLPAALDFLSAHLSPPLAPAAAPGHPKTVLPTPAPAPTARPVAHRSRRP